MTALIHIAGIDVCVNDRLRQRCGWCGALIIDYDLTRVAVPAGQDPRPATWPVGALVAIDGGMSYTVEQNDTDPLPDGACAVIDAEVTR